MAPGNSPGLDHPRSFWPTAVSHTNRQPLSRISVWHGKASTTLLRSGCALSFGGGPPNSINARLPLRENAILKSSTEHRQSIPHSVPILCNALEGKRRRGIGTQFRSLSSTRGAGHDRDVLGSIR